MKQIKNSKIFRKTIAFVLTLLLVISMSAGFADTKDVHAAGSMTITVSDSLFAKLTESATDINTAVIGSISDITGLESFDFTETDNVYIYYSYWHGYDDADWSDAKNNRNNCIQIDFSGKITKESYDAFLTSGITTVTIQGMEIPKRDWDEGWAMYQIGGEDPKGEFDVYPAGGPEPDGTYGVVIDVRIPINESKYKITAGGGSSHTAGASEDLKITCDGALEDLVSISVDGSVIDSANYTLESGSTILTLKASYLNTLSAGSHKVTFTYKDGQSASADFTIAEQTQVTASQQTTTTSNAPTSPKTGDYTSVSPNMADNTLVIVFIAFVLVLGISFLAIGYKRMHR